jgi:hypothetical protein
MKALSDLLKLAPPKLITLDSLDDDVRLYVIGDVHEGERGSDEVLIRHVVNMIAKDPRGFVIMTGDLASYIPPDDKRWCPMDIAPKYTISDLARWGDVLNESLCEYFRPISHKIIAMAPGNHEVVYGRRHHCDLTANLAQMLSSRGRKIAVLEYVNEFGLMFREEGRRGETVTLNVHQTHGKGNATNHTSRLTKLRSVMDTTTADLTIVSHFHGRVWEQKNRMHRVGEHLEYITQYGVISGAFVHTYHEGPSSYAEINHYQVNKPGCPCLTITPRTLDINCSWIQLPTPPTCRWLRS